jgi:hypothetical protein
LRSAISGRSQTWEGRMENPLHGERYSSRIQSNHHFLVST